MSMLRLSLVATLVISLFSPVASAQTSSLDRLSGRIADAQGGAVVDALVTLTLGNGRVRTTRSTADGSFSFDQVPPGEYLVEVDSPGFIHWRQRVAVGAVGSPVAVTLQVAGVSENIEVVASAPATLERPAFTGSRLGLTPLETPASIQILPGEVIRERGDVNIPDAKSRAVGVTAQPTPGNGGGGLAARGFGGVGSVMQLYDGSLLMVGSGTVSFPFDTWTVDRIEVLGGPASVMFGTGAIGGVINVVPRKPNSRAFEHSARVAAGSDNTWRAAIDTTGPLTNRVSYRLDLSHNRSDGWMDRGNSDSTAFSGSLRFDARPNLSFTVSEDYGYQNPETYFGVPLINGQIDESLRRSNFNVPDADIYYKDNWAQFRTEWRPFSNVAVRNNLQRLSTKRHWLNAERYVYQPASGSVLRSDFLEIFHLQRQYGNRTEAVITSEIAGRSNAVSVGFDYNWIRFEHQNNSPYGGSALVPLNSPGSGTFINLAGTFPKFRSLSHQVAFFAEDRLALGARVSLVGGVRVDRYDAERRDLVTGITYPKEVTPSSARGGLVYLVRPDLSLYAQYSTATDFIGNLITQSPVQQAFDPTTGRQIEVGSKQAFWNGRGEWTVAAYQIVKKKLLASNPDNPAVQIQIGQQSSVGVEASALVALMNAVRIEANITALRPRFDDFYENVGGVRTSRVGNTPPGVPKRAANLWITWSPLPEWQARGGVRVVGGRFANNANTDKIPSYTVIDLGLRRSLTDRMAVDLRLYNAFDKIYPMTTYGGVNQWLLGRQRAVEISLTTNF